MGGGERISTEGQSFHFYLSDSTPEERAEKIILPVAAMALERFLDGQRREPLVDEERQRRRLEAQPLRLSSPDPNGLGKRKDPGETGRFRRFSRSDIQARGFKLDVTWLKDDSLEDSDDLPEPQDLAAEAITELQAVVDDLREIVALVQKEEAMEACD